MQCTAGVRTGKGAPAKTRALAKPARASSQAGGAKPRLPFLDGLRGALVAYISVGHFAPCVVKGKALLGSLTQVNVAVSGLFAISGYAAAYASTRAGDLGEEEGKLEPALSYTARRVASFYPLHALTLLVFSPVFLLADLHYNGLPEACLRGALSLSLLQAWWPMRAESWNSPTWFLSSLSFCLLVMPYALPHIAGFRRRGLKLALALMCGILMLGKIAYSHDINAWPIFDALVPGKAHPNLVTWNATRFSPFQALLEVLAGACSARLVMLDGREGEGMSPTAEPALPPLVVIASLIVLRAAGFVSMNDGLTRSVVFFPLFLNALTNLHRLQIAQHTTNFLPSLFLTSNGLLQLLGSIAFPLFILHAPLGQILYKRAVAQKLWGGTFQGRPGVFFGWLALCLVASFAAQRFVVQNRRVQAIANGLASALTRLCTSPEYRQEQAGHGGN